MFENEPKHYIFLWYILNSVPPERGGSHKIGTIDEEWSVPDALTNAHLSNSLCVKKQQQCCQRSIVWMLYLRHHDDDMHWSNQSVCS